MSLTLTGFKLPFPLTGKSKKSRGKDTQIYFWLKLKSEKLILEIDQFSTPFTNNHQLIFYFTTIF